MKRLIRALAPRVATWWLENRPIKRWKAKRAGQPLDEVAEPFNQPDEEVPAMLDKLLEAIAQYRTSTKSGATGLVVPPVAAALVLLPFYDHVEAFVKSACDSGDPMQFVVAAAVGWAVTWVSMFVSARKSKTPTDPGPL